MCTALMPTKLACTGKALATHGTFKWTLGFVQPPVVAKVPCIRELLATVATDIVLVTSMCNPDVFLHVMQPCERLATVRTEDATLVHSPVISILSASIHLLATQLAPVQYFPSMQPFVFR